MRIFHTIIILTAALFHVAGISAAEQVAIEGIVAAEYDASLSIRLPGIVNMIHVEEGSKVKQGDPLLELEHKAEQLEVSRRELIMKDKTGPKAAADKLAAIKKDLESTRKLFKDSASVSGDELEAKELAYKLAAAEIEKLKVEKEREKIEYQMALEALELRKLKAPAGGIINSVMIEKGEHVQPHQELFRLVNTDECRLECDVTEREAPLFNKDDTVPLVFDLPAGKHQVQSKVVFISPVVDPASGLKRIHLLFSNPDGRVNPGTRGAALVSAKQR